MEINNLQQFAAAYWQQSLQVTLLGSRQGERLSREEIRHRTLRRYFSDPVFAHRLIHKTRWMMAVILDECLGINRYMFMSRIHSYPVLYESTKRLYLELPSCHQGCALPGTVAKAEEHKDDCKVCARAFPLPAGSTFVLPEARFAGTMTRRGIEHLIQKRVAWDPKFAEDLGAKPLDTYKTYATHLCAGRTPRYLEGVEDLELVYETGGEMFLIVPTCEAFALERGL